MGCQPILPNDLCYSEHFISDPAPYIYADYEELLSKTLFFIKTWKFKSPKTDNPSIKDYNWKKVVERYDNYLEGIV
jgi:hypothetical protein